MTAEASNTPSQPFKEDYPGFRDLLLNLIAASLTQTIEKNMVDGSLENPEAGTLNLGSPACISLFKTFTQKNAPPKAGDAPQNQILEALSWDEIDLAMVDALKSLAKMSRDAGFEPLGTLTGQQTSKPPILRDQDGFGREVYLPVVLHLFLVAFAYRQEKMSVEHWGACEGALAQACGMMMDADRYLDQAPPANQVAAISWQSLVRLEFGLLFKRESDIEAQLGLIDKIVHLNEGAGESPLTPTPDPTQQAGSLDLWTFEELAGLGALSHIAIRLRRQDLAQRVKQIASYHVEHTQPDYTTSQPWGVFAFIWDQRFTHFAKQQLFDAQSYGSTHGQSAPGVISVISAILLTDALAQLIELLEISTT